MNPKFYPENAPIFEAKEDIPYWMIANKLGCHVNTVRNWMKSKMTSRQKEAILFAIEELKKEM